MLLLLISFTSVQALACYSDFDCGLNGSCRRPEGSISTQGMCVQNTQVQQSEIVTCHWDTECGFGGVCAKQGYNTVGICVK